MGNATMLREEMAQMTMRKKCYFEKETNDNPEKIASSKNPQTPFEYPVY